jgi:phosphate transport system protein
MQLQHEESVDHDIDRIKELLVEMARLAELSLHHTLKAMREIDQTLAYGIILRDQLIDEKEKAVDRLCLEFMVKQQPVSMALRFVFSAMKINLEIERVGDYAESIARHILKMDQWPEHQAAEGIIELAGHAIAMFHDAMESFMNRSADLARSTIAREEKADALRDACINNLLAMAKDQPAPLALLNIVRRFERVADQARDICMETLYLCTGEYVKHPGADVIRVLFVDEHNSVQSRIAEAVANGLDQPKFIFSSAGIDPEPIDARTIGFMKEKGYDLSDSPPRALAQVPHLDYYQVIVSFSPEVRRSFTSELSKTMYLDWEIETPSLSRDDTETVNAGYENIFNFTTRHVSNLVSAINGSGRK